MLWVKITLTIVISILSQILPKGKDIEKFEKVIVEVVSMYVIVVMWALL